MNEREVKDNDNLTWKCVQAYSGSNGAAAREATRLAENNDAVEVVCTPSGGGQTVRLKLSPDWMDQVSDQELVSAIQQKRK